MNQRLAFFTALATTFLSGSTAWACISAMYGPAQTTPLDFLPLGVTAASISLLAMKADAPLTQGKQLKRFGIWMVVSFVLGIFGATGYGFDPSGVAFLGGVGAVVLLGGVMLRGLPRLRKFILAAGMLFGFLGSLALFANVMLGDPKPVEKFEAQAIEHTVTF